MKLKADLFPYPVLNDNLDDYLGSEFKVDMTIVEQTPYKCVLHFDFSLDDARLKKLMQLMLFILKVRTQVIDNYLKFQP